MYYFIIKNLIIIYKTTEMGKCSQYKVKWKQFKNSIFMSLCVKIIVSYKK